MLFNTWASTVLSIDIDVEKNRRRPLCLFARLNNTTTMPTLMKI